MIIKENQTYWCRRKYWDYKQNKMSDNPIWVTEKNMLPKWNAMYESVLNFVFIRHTLQKCNQIMIIIVRDEMNLMENIDRNQKLVDGVKINQSFL